MNFCLNCGYKLNADDEFCSNCGTRVSKKPEPPEQSAPTLPSAPPLPIPEESIEVDSQPQFQQPTPQSTARESGSPLPESAAPRLKPQEPGSEPRSHKKLIFILGAIIVVIALVAAGVVTHRMGLWGQQAPVAAVAKSALKKKTIKPFAFNQDDLDGIIAEKDPESKAAVAHTTADGSSDYSTDTSGTRYSASGLYLPVYLAAQDEGLASTEQNTMMSSMDNDAANSLISSLGGLPALNSWLDANGYDDTTFARNFGDIKASEAGRENYTTATDATKMLQAVTALDSSALPLMDSMDLPQDDSARGHRGQGLKILLTISFNSMLPIRRLISQL